MKGSAFCEMSGARALREKKLALMREIYRMTEEEAGVVLGGGPLERLLEILDEKQKLMDEIDALDRELGGYLAGVPGEAVGGDQSGEVGHLEVQIREVATGIRSLMDENKRRLEEALSRVRMEYGKFKRAREVLDSYVRAAGPAGGVFVDKKK